jgi:threonine dehydratase
MALSGDDLAADGQLFVKLEHLQHSGSFKARGAANTMLSEPIAPAGVVAASGGNHGAAVAWAARAAGHRATIFVPEVSAPTKIERLRSYGADVHITGAVYADALEASRSHSEDTGATAIHAYDQLSVVAGAGTVGLELEDQVGQLDAVLVACGGGGLAGGLATWFGDTTQIIVVETTQTATFAHAVAASGPTPIEVGGVAADSLGATQLGQLGWAALSAVRTTSVLVTDDEVLQAQDLLWDRFRQIVEPAAAAPVAALLTGRYRPDGNDRTALIVCGANTAR